MPGRSHSRQFKLDCVRQVAAGHKRPAQICREHNLSESVLLRWRKEYEARGEEAFTESSPPLARRSCRRGSRSSSASAASSPWRTRS